MRQGSRAPVAWNHPRGVVKVVLSSPRRVAAALATSRTALLLL
jgi:hypothetical protein